MNNATFENSQRLQRVYKVLQDCKPHSTMEIIKAANVCAVNSIISELRFNGFDINCKRENNIWLYKLEK